MDALLERLNQILALLEEQTYYLSLLLPDQTDEDSPDPPQAPVNPPAIPAPVSMLHSIEPLVEMMSLYLLSHPESVRAGPARKILPRRLPLRAQ